MKLQIDQRGSDVFHRREPHVVGRGGQKSVAQGVGHRRAGFGVGGEFGKDFGNVQPVFVKLAGQFDEIACDRGAADRLIGHIRQHLVQGVTEFMKQSARVVIGQQCRIGMGEIADIHHDGTNVAVESGLRTHRTAPCTRPLAGPREVIAEEDGDVFAVARHFPAPHVRVIERAVQRSELQPEQPCGAGKGGVNHPVELKEGLEFGFIQVMQLQTPLFGIEAPVPRLQRARDTIHLRHARKVFRIGQRRRPRRMPDLHQQVPHCFGRLGHFGFQLVIGEAVIAQQLRAFVTQGQNFGGVAPVVGLAPVGTAGDPGFIGFLSQVPAGRELQKRHDQRAVESDGGTGAVAFLTGGAGGGFHELGQARQVVFRQVHEPFPFIRQKILAEGGAQSCKARFDGSQASGPVSGQRRAGANEPPPRQHQHTCLLLAQTQRIASAPQVLDPGEKFGVVGYFRRIGG